MALPGTYNIPDHKKGDTWEGPTIVLSDAAPIDLTGARVDMFLRVRSDSPTPTLTWSTADSTITIVNAAGGELLIVDRVIGITAGTYVYDLVVTDANSVVKTYLSGTFTIIE